MSKPAKPTKRDPIYAAIERYQRIEAQFDACPEDCLREQRLGKRSVAARRALARTVPATLDGLVTLAQFLQAESRKLRCSFFDNSPEHEAFYASLRRSLEKIAASQSAVPAPFICSGSFCQSPGAGNNPQSF